MRPWVRKVIRHWGVTLLSAAFLAGFIRSLLTEPGGFAPFSQNPWFGPPLESLLRAGARCSPCISFDHEYWRLFTSNFLHGGVIHLVLNTLAFIQLGTQFRQDWLIALFIATGMAGMLSSTLFLVPASRWAPQVASWAC